ncbi:hypothetical protein D1872_273540 [compost metagenome]
MSTENNMNANEYTSTQLMKFGKVVSVCTIFLNFVLLSSIRNTAKITGNMEVAIFKLLMATVLRSTLIIS